jgi:exportin-5
MRDTRSCSFITRVLRSLIPEFDAASPIAIDVQEFISTEVLKACITSLHDSYFVDMQKDLAQLIASIVTTYSGRTDTPRNILLSLPTVTDVKVDRTIRQLAKVPHNSRQQRALILDLLAGLRGVSISEQGKVPKPDTKKLRSAMQEKYMTLDIQADDGRGDSPDLDGFARLFVQSDTV